MKILLILLTLLPSISLAKDISYFDYEFSIPDSYKIVENNLSDKSNGLFILIEDKKVAFSIEKKDENFFSLKEHGANSHRELFYVLFNNEPSDNKAILELRATLENYKLQKQSIYKNDNDFVFFRTDNGMDLIGTATIIVSTPINEVLVIGFNKGFKEEFIQSVLASFVVNK
ncbi:MAG: hypothetical protein L3J59_10140 [Methylococcaceae bacterium]|nr:hypothetical protein [Methylococcaceae bacterium]